MSNETQFSIMEFIYWAFGRNVVSSPLLQHRYGQFRSPPQPGSVASSCPTSTPVQPPPLPLMQPSVPAPPQPTHTATTSDTTSAKPTHHPTTPTAAATGPTDQRSSASPWSSTNYQIWAGNTPTTKVQALCSFLGGHWKTIDSWESKPLFASSTFVMISFAFFVFVFISRDGGMSHYVTLLFCITRIWLLCNPTFSDERVLVRVQQIVCSTWTSRLFCCRITSSRYRPSPSLEFVRVGGETIQPSSSVRNLGVILDPSVDMEDH